MQIRTADGVTKLVDRSKMLTIHLQRKERPLNRLSKNFNISKIKDNSTDMTRALVQLWMVYQTWWMTRIRQDLIPAVKIQLKRKIQKEKGKAVRKSTTFTKSKWPKSYRKSTSRSRINWATYRAFRWLRTCRNRKILNNRTLIHRSIGKCFLLKEVYPPILKTRSLLLHLSLSSIRSTYNRRYKMEAFTEDTSWTT